MRPTSYSAPMMRRSWLISPPSAASNCRNGDSQRLRAPHDVFGICSLLGGSVQNFRQFALADVFAPLAHDGLQGASPAGIFGNLTSSRQKTKMCHCFPLIFAVRSSPPGWALGIMHIKEQRRLDQLRSSGHAAAPPRPAMNSRRRRQMLICPSCTRSKLPRQNSTVQGCGP